jgi:serine/threonine protein kinase
MSSLLPVALEFAKSRNLKDVAFEAKGAYKETYRTTNEKGQIVALKLLEPSKCNPARSEREINALKKCDSALIAKLYDYGDISISGVKYYFSIEEFLDGGTLTNQIAAKTLTADVIRDYAIALIQALDYLRTAELVHRDIKPDNIMFRRNDPAPVLVDFGLVRDLSESSLTQTWLPQGPGTPYYSAPEQLNNDKQLIGWRTDQFSLGVVLSICLTGKHPFAVPAASMPEVVDAVAQRKPCVKQFSDEVTALGFAWLVRMVEVWPVRRYLTPSMILETIRE